MERYILGQVGCWSTEVQWSGLVLWRELGWRTNPYFLEEVKEGGVGKHPRSSITHFTIVNIVDRADRYIHLRKGLVQKETKDRNSIYIGLTFEHRVDICFLQEMPMN